MRKVFLYKSCADLSIRRFDAIYNTGDLKFLCVDYDGYEDIDVPEEAEQRWKDIMDEWVKVCDNRTLSYYYQLIREVAYLETRFYVSKEMLGQIYTRYPHAMDETMFDLYIEELAKWKYHYNKENTVLDEVHRLLNQHKASENKLGIKKSELDNLRKENEQEDAQTLEAQAVVLEHITGKNTIDVDTTSVLKWIEIGKLATSINEQRRKNAK